MKVLKDILDQEIKEGDFIVYAIRSGNSGDMKIGLVIDVSEKKDEYSDRTELKIGVYGYDSYWKINSRKSYLQYPSRIAVVPANKVPEKIKKQYAEKGLINIS